MLQVVEIAPAYGLDEEVRRKLHADAVKLAKHVGYVRFTTYTHFELLLMSLSVHRS